MRRWDSQSFFLGSFFRRGSFSLSPLDEEFLVFTRRTPTVRFEVFSRREELLFPSPLKEISFLW